jgi:REP element-mobilizing transposase RayT
MPESAKPTIGNRALRRYRTSLSGHYYHVTTATYLRRPLFAEFRAARSAIRALNSSEALAGSELIAWVLMPDHLHALVRLADDAELPRLMNRIKAATGRAVNRHFGTQGKVWQAAYHDHLIRNDENLQNVARYIVMNPLRANLVKRVSQYPHWDAVWV